jgi:hypothetical protein
MDKLPSYWLCDHDPLRHAARLHRLLRVHVRQHALPHRRAVTDGVRE